ncbi:hypothetical protein KBD08_03515 [Candidatus Babeliales bacterium]|nr:hypothetical protein [Candidatus Babeliales bacterium]
MKTVCIMRVVCCALLILHIGTSKLFAAEGFWNNVRETTGNVAGKIGTVFNTNPFAVTKLSQDVEEQIAKIAIQSVEEIKSHVTMPQGSRYSNCIYALSKKNVLAGVASVGLTAGFLAYWYYTMSWISEAQDLIAKSQEDPNAMLYEMMILLQSWSGLPSVQAKIIQYLASSMVITPELLSVFDQYRG